jgi:myo-inositol-1(or 4)-monophosphatase
MNFVLEKENFCIMVAVYEEGQGRFGFVYNVMKDEFLWGGPEIGVFCIMGQKLIRRKILL